MSPSGGRQVTMLQDISSSYLDLIDLFEQFPAEQLVAPNTFGSWSGKVTITHLVDWEVVLKHHIEALNRDAVLEWPTKRRNNDTANEEMLEQSRGTSVNDVPAYFEDTLFKMMELLETSDLFD